MYEDILKKYGAKIEKELLSEKAVAYSQEYKRFKEETMPKQTGFEKLCSNFGKIIKVKVSKKDEEKIAKQLEIAHVDVSAGDVASFSLFVFLSAIFLSIVIIVAIYLAAGKFSAVLAFLFFLSSIFVYYYVSSIPERLAREWRLKASSQMVPCILYIVVYMRHTSNLELAIKFASEHLQAPLALDFKKIFWDVETAKYANIKDALDAYLEKWRDYSLEFVEAFHLIESSLYEPTEARRIEILEKSLLVILDGVYEKMLRYSHDVQAPLTNIYMLGIVLPTLAIALLPLASTLLEIKWYYIFLIFNLIIPFFVFYMTSDVLSKRPGGYGETELLEQNPLYAEYKSKKHFYKSIAIAIPLFIISIIPFIFLAVGKDYTFAQLGIPMLQELKIFDFKDSRGPFGVVALLLSLCMPLSISLFFSMAYKSKTQKIIKTREETRRLEKEFASSLFTLGNRLGDGIPAEMAFGRVAQSLKGTPTADFFSMVDRNIMQGSSVKEAIFNKKRGALIYFPSRLVETSMLIMVESVKKGLNIAARALTSISQYAKNIDKINERLRDLLAEIISGMKSNISFLAPVLAGIVVGLAAMITTILNRLQTLLQMGAIGEETAVGIGSAGAITKLFDVTKMIPPYFLQVSVGLYLIEIIFILSSTLVSINYGSDKLAEKNEIAKNLARGMTMYLVVSLIAIFALTLLAGIAITGVSQ